MIATKATEAIEQAVCYELQNIVKKYGATYNSEHEAYAVLKEEVEEAVDAVNELDQKLSDIWLCIKNNFVISEYTSHLCSSATKREVLSHGSPSIWRTIQT